MQPEGSSAQWHGYYIGGVPPLEYFLIKLKSATELLSQEVTDPELLDEKAELCLIAFLAYFEAFCKALFAALVNICPQLMLHFGEKSRRCELDVREILTIRDHLHDRLGSLVSEKYDFGSAKNINSLFYDLLKLTPFSKTDGQRYSQLQNDRNLLVHHGGIYTYKYAGQKFIRRRAGRLAAWDSLVVTSTDAKATADFLSDTARKCLNLARKHFLNLLSLKLLNLVPRAWRPL